MSDADQRTLAVAAAAQATIAAGELLQFLSDGPWGDAPLDPENSVIESLLDAAKLAIELQRDTLPSGYAEIYAAIIKHLGEWAG